MNTPKKKPEGNKLIGLAIVLLFTAPQLMIPILVIWGIVTAVKKYASQSGTGSAAPKSQAPTRYTTRQASFDECPEKLFCFHKDKAVHHVRRGKEIDPWDRPDIDISKYQRKT